MQNLLGVLHDFPIHPGERGQHAASDRQADLLLRMFVQRKELDVTFDVDSRCRVTVVERSRYENAIRLVGRHYDVVHR